MWRRTNFVNARNSFAGTSVFGQYGTDYSQFEEDG